MRGGPRASLPPNDQPWLAPKDSIARPNQIQNENHRLYHLLPLVKKHSHDIRDGNKYELPKVLKRIRKSFIITGAFITCNNLSSLLISVLL